MKKIEFLQKKKCCFVFTSTHQCYSMLPFNESGRLEKERVLRYVFSSVYVYTLVERDLISDVLRRSISICAKRKKKNKDYIQQ